MRGIHLLLIALTAAVAGCAERGSETLAGVEAVASTASIKEGIEIDRYEADVVIAADPEETRTFKKGKGPESRFRLARYRDHAGNWWTSVDLSERHIRRAKGRRLPDNIPMRFEFQDDGRLVRSYSASGTLTEEFDPSHRRPRSSSGEIARLTPAARRTATSNQWSLDELIVTPAAGARIRARLEKGRPVHAPPGVTKRLLAVNDTSTIEVAMEDSTGAVLEEVVRLRGKPAQTTRHEYRRGPHGLLLRTRTTVERPAAGGRSAVRLETRFENTRVSVRGGSHA